MQNPVEQLKKEHEIFNGLIDQFDSLTTGSHDGWDVEKIKGVFNRLDTLWGVHEKKEEKLFPQMHDDLKIEQETERMIREHRELRPHKEALERAIISGDLGKVRDAIDEHRDSIVRQLEDHFKFEEEHLFNLALRKYSGEELVGMMQS